MRPLLSCECVECPSHRAEREQREARVAALERERDSARDAMSHGDMLWQGKLDGAERRVATLTAALEVYRDKDGLRTREHNLLVEENRALQARVAALTAALRDVTCAKQFGCDETFCAYPDDCALDAAAGGA